MYLDQKTSDATSAINIYPKPGRDYTLREIHGLTLRDSPCLSFRHEGKECCVQDSHLTVEQELALPGFAESIWTYRYETSEWVPVFRYAGAQPITDLVEFKMEHGEQYAYPKGSI